MPEEGFLRRWARVKATGADAVEQAAPAAPAVQAMPPVLPTAVPAPAEPARSAPTLIEAARLTADSDFSAFVSPLVDQDVRRLALKKLFADPHFNVLDRLDMYMDDYNKPDPVSAAMLAALDHARGTLRRPEEVEAALAQLRAQNHPAEGADAAPVVADDVPDAPAEASVALDDASDDPVDAPPEPVPAPAVANEHESDDISDVIALTPVRAHNARAGL